MKELKKVRFERAKKIINTMMLKTIKKSPNLGDTVLQINFMAQKIQEPKEEVEK